VKDNEASLLAQMKIVCGGLKISIHCICSISFIWFISSNPFCCYHTISRLSHSSGWRF